MNRIRTAVIVIAISGLCVAAGAQEKPKGLTPEQQTALKSVSTTVSAWGRDSVLVSEVKAQNALKVSMVEIQQIDKTWIEGGEADRANRLLSNACAKQLKKLVSSSPNYNESFVMDDQGANVCMTDRTSDFWQGDEAKWQKSFNSGNGAVFIDQPKYDASAKAILVQISVPVYDGARTIGAITVGVNLSQLTAGK